ncbi:MAG: MerR family transcriptional regulator [Deltaproteobacteria bacterium]|nr:MerR family transcriptional regulator [Candidatus Anaeroferrophillacea bacterium]
MTGSLQETADTMRSYRIGELGKLLDISPRTIRYYEEIGLLNTVKRMEGGRRIYTDDDLRRLRFIKKLKLLGLSLNEMAELERIYSIHRSNRKVLPRVVELLHHHRHEIDTRISELRKLKGEISSYIDRIEEKLYSV